MTCNVASHNPKCLSSTHQYPVMTLKLLVIGVKVVHRNDGLWDWYVTQILEYNSLIKLLVQILGASAVKCLNEINEK